MANYIDLCDKVSDYLFQESCNNEEVVLEGATLEINKIFKEIEQKYRTTVKSIRTDIKDKKYDDALKGLDELKKLIKDYEDEIDSHKDDIGSIIGGHIFESWASWLKAALLSMISFGIMGVVSQIKDCIDIINGEIKQWRDNNNEFTIEMLNSRRAKIKGMFKEFYDVIDKMKKEIKDMIDKEKKEEKGDKEVKESAMTIEDVKLAVFESWHSGEISNEERDILLEMI